MFNKILGWTACVITLAGAFCTSLRIDPMNLILLNCGSALYLWWGWRIKEHNLILVNAVLLMIYVPGLFITR